MIIGRHTENIIKDCEIPIKLLGSINLKIKRVKSITKNMNIDNPIHRSMYEKNLYLCPSVRIIFLF